MRLLLPLAFAAVVLAGCEAASPTAVDPARSPAAPSFTGTGACAPHGYVVLSGWNYDWIANGTPMSTNCWSPGYGDTFVTGTTTCGYSANAIAFGYAGGISQEFTIPSDWTESHFGLSYDLDFIDPNHDGAWNRLTVEVLDVTTNVVLASEAFYGNGTLPQPCDHRMKSWTGNLAGHTLQVRFSGSKAYSDTYIRVRNIALFQSL